ncbi:MAG: acyl-ACP--UDP-N-acetylglucosamine O-acyltransferase [Planctomycetes bacterium]|nr:acyl-ACP--UDP-N-acetylglucosamine O-acyltransferase [Planctomycetota bacterium]
MAVHPTAIVADGAELGADVEIGPYCVVGPQVRLGDGCRLQSHVVVDGDTWLGAGCSVFPHAVLGTTPQDKKLDGKPVSSKLRIGDHNQIREFATVHGGTEYGGGVTQIGSHNMLLVGSHIGHDAVVGDHVIFTNGAMAAGHTLVGDHAILGAMVGVHQFARVGPFSMIGAGAMLSKDAPPFSLVQGDRARLISINTVGLKRSDFRTHEIANIKRAFRRLFWHGGLLEERVAAVAELAAEDHNVRSIVAFIRESRRGLVMPRGRHEPHDDSPAA